MYRTHDGYFTLMFTLMFVSAHDLCPWQRQLWVVLSLRHHPFVLFSFESQQRHFVGFPMEGSRTLHFR